MNNLVSIMGGIELKKKVEQLERLVLAVDVKNERMDYLNTGCITLSAATKIIEDYIKKEKDAKIFEGAREQIITIYEKKISDLRALKFVPPSNIVTPSFDLSGGDND